MNNEIVTGGLFAAIGGALAYLFGPWDAPIIVLLCVVAMDYLTGVAYAAVSKELCSVPSASDSCARAGAPSTSKNHSPVSTI